MSAALNDAPADGWLRDAAQEWHARLPLPRLGTAEGDAVAWGFANVCAGYDNGSMMRALVDMGLRRVATMTRGEIRYWPPEYHRPQHPSERDRCAALNRFIRDSRVFVMREAAGDGAVIPPPDLLLLVDADGGDGAWRTCSGGAQGEDWVSLGAFCWRCARAKAAARLARLSGYRRLPRVGDL